MFHKILSTIAIGSLAGILCLGTLTYAEEPAGGISEDASTTTVTEATTEVTTQDPAVYENPETLVALSTFFGEPIRASYEIHENRTEIIPLEIVSQGDVTLKIEYPKLNSDFKLQIYSNDSLITPIQTSILNQTAQSVTTIITAGASETLYLAFSPIEDITVDTAYNFTLTATLRAASEQTVSTKKTLKNKTWTAKKMITTKSKIYYKLSIKKNCYIYMNSNNKRVNLKLLDAKKKKSLSSTIGLKPSNNYQASFALSKGTYYIKVTTPYQTTFQLYYHCTNVSNNFGKAFKKAKSMSFGKQYINILPANQSATKGQYFKFKLSSAKKLQLVFYVENSNSSFVLQVYDSNKHQLPTSPYMMSNGGLLYIDSIEKIPKGTYYLKVSKKSAASSGCYSVMARTK